MSSYASIKTDTFPLFCSDCLSRLLLLSVYFDSEMYDKEEFNRTECFWADFTVNTDFVFPVKMGDFALLLNDISKYAFSFSLSRTVR